MNLKFKTPFGTAGGLDKTAQDLKTWEKYGAGFLELGTFTPRPQGPNPGKIIDKDLSIEALWNCMGFPNPGFDKVLPLLEKYKKSTPNNLPLFINIGKNRDTAFEDSFKDYLLGLQKFKNIADCFVINISSPNTKGLRLLHLKENFENFIAPIVNYINESELPPILIKLSPDLNSEDFSTFIQNSLHLPFKGYTISNTTTYRPPGCSFPKKGGLSGKPLSSNSREKLKIAKRIISNSTHNKVIISVGGVLTPEEACKRIELGADLVQFYSGLVLKGPSLFHNSNKNFINQVKGRSSF